MSEVKSYFCSETKGEHTYLYERKRKKNERTGKWVPAPGSRYLGKFDPTTGELIPKRTGTQPKIETIQPSIPATYIGKTIKNAVEKRTNISVPEEYLGTVKDIGVRLIQRWVGNPVAPIDDAEATYEALLEVGDQVGTKTISFDSPSASDIASVWTYSDEAIYPVEMTDTAENTKEPINFRKDHVFFTCGLKPNTVIPVTLQIDTGQLRAPKEDERRGDWYRECEASEYGIKRLPSGAVPVLWNRGGAHSYRAAIPNVDTPTDAEVQAATFGKIAGGLIIAETIAVLDEFKRKHERFNRKTDQGVFEKLLRGVGVSMMGLWITLNELLKKGEENCDEKGMSEFINQLRASYRITYEDQTEERVGDCLVSWILKKEKKSKS